MKSTLCCISLVLAICFPKYFGAYERGSELCFKASQTAHIDSNAPNTLGNFFDVCCEDLYGDDEHEPKSKETKIDSAFVSCISFLVQNHSENNTRIVLPTDLPFPCKISRHILLCVLLI